MNKKEQKIIGFAEKATRTNSGPQRKPNDDYVLIDNKNQIFIITDGVTNLENGKYEKPSQAYEASKLFSKMARQAFLTKIRNNPIRVSSIFAIEQANKQLQKFNKKRFEESDYQKKDLTGTVGIVSAIKNNTFYYCYIGDCIGFILIGKKIKQFTRDQLQKLKRAQKKDSSNILTRFYIHKNIRNNINHPLGYGVLNGMKEAMSFLKCGKIKLLGGERIILATDGLERFFKKNKTELLINHNPTTLINNAIVFGKIKNLKSDDKSVIIIKIKKIQNNH